MCNVHSFIVTPSCEIFDLPNAVHHTDICAGYSLHEDTVMKPEFWLWDRTLHDTSAPTLQLPVIKPLQFGEDCLNNVEEPEYEDVWHDVDGELKDKYHKKINFYLNELFGTRKKMIAYAEKNWAVVVPKSRNFFKESYLLSRLPTTVHHILPESIIADERIDDTIHAMIYCVRGRTNSFRQYTESISLPFTKVREIPDALQFVKLTKRHLREKLLTPKVEIIPPTHAQFADFLNDDVAVNNSWLTVAHN